MNEQQNGTPAAIPETTPPEEMSIDLVELMYRLLSKWVLIVGLALVGAIGFGAYTHYCVAPTYVATAHMYIVGNRDTVVNMSDLQIGAALTDDYIKVFKMWEVHDKVITNLKLDYSYSQIRSMLSVTNDSNTRVLDIKVTSTSPEEAAIIANEYAKVACSFISEKMSTEPPNIMSTALVPSSPIGPSMTRNVMLGFILGAAIACAYVVIMMLMDDKYKTADDIRRYTGLTTLAAIPEEPKESKRKSSRRAN